MSIIIMPWSSSSNWSIFFVFVFFNLRKRLRWIRESIDLITFYSQSGIGVIIRLEMVIVVPWSSIIWLVWSIFLLGKRLWWIWESIDLITFNIQSWISVAVRLEMIIVVPWGSIIRLVWSIFFFN